MKAVSLLALAVISVASPALCQDQQSFYPTWKLLSEEAKEQFVAGYLEGWRDAGAVTEVATEYVRQNPEKAVEGLEKIRSLYDLSSFNASALSREIDRFYKDPANSTASLSRAVSAASQRLGQ